MGRAVCSVSQKKNPDGSFRQFRGLKTLRIFRDRLEVTLRCCTTSMTHSTEDEVRPIAICLAEICGREGKLASYAMNQLYSEMPDSRKILPANTLKRLVQFFPTITSSSGTDPRLMIRDVRPLIAMVYWWTVNPPLGGSFGNLNPVAPPTPEVTEKRQNTVVTRVRRGSMRGGAGGKARPRARPRCGAGSNFNKFLSKDVDVTPV